MFAAVYAFEVKKGCDEKFIHAWSELTKLIYKHEGSLGSRLHKSGTNSYIAYAQWPHKDVWSNSGSNLPESAQEFRNEMKNCCSKIETVYELDLVADLLQNESI